jgi:hypothetical protein
MSLVIDVRSDLRQTALSLSVNAAKVIEAAAVRSLNRAATTVRAEASRRIRDRYNLKVSVIKNDLRLVRARRGELEAQVIARGAPIPLIQFGARQTRAGVSVQVVRSNPRSILRRVFVARMKSGHVGVYERRGKSRLPIDERYTIGVPTMFAQRQIISALRGVAGERFRRELARELKFRSGNG